MKERKKKERERVPLFSCVRRDNGCCVGGPAAYNHKVLLLLLLRLRVHFSRRVLRRARTVRIE